MPARSKFTAERRERIIQALRIGTSRRTAAAIAGVDEATLRRWLEQGKTASEGSRFREFYETVLEAEAHPKERALGIIYQEMQDNPNLAWKFIERREDGFAPPAPQEPQRAIQATSVIKLYLPGGRPMPTGDSVIEASVVDEQDGTARALPDTAS